MFTLLSETKIFAVWNVWGFDACGNVRLLAVYHYADKTRADEHAGRVKGGYVLRSKQEIQPEREV